MRRTISITTLEAPCAASSCSPFPPFPLMFVGNAIQTLCNILPTGLVQVFGDGEPYSRIQPSMIKLGGYRFLFVLLCCLACLH